jgi:hypothetical protein
MDIETMVKIKKRHIRRALVVAILICAAVCAKLAGGAHFASAKNHTEINMSFYAKCIHEIDCSPGVDPESRTFYDFVDLLLRERMKSFDYLFMRPVWIDDSFCHSAWSSYRINCDSRRRIYSNLGELDSGNFIRRRAPSVSSFKVEFGRFIRDEFRAAGRVDLKIGAELPYFSIPHLSQLTAHRIPLEQRGEERQYSYPGDYPGPNDQLASDRRELPRFPYERVFLGICVIGLGWTCLWFSFESFEKISQSPRYMAGGIILGLTAIALIGHGLFYACLGVWGLPSLYIL